MISPIFDYSGRRISDLQVNLTKKGIPRKESNLFPFQSTLRATRIFHFGFLPRGMKMISCRFVEMCVVI